jgi:endonuclease III
MDRQIKAERAWTIPKFIKDDLGTFGLDELSKQTQDYYLEVFTKNKLHRYNETMAKVFYSAVQRIKNEYGGDASIIWSDKPSSASVVYRFLQFDGCGIKIATMAANILARQFKVRFSDYYSIDISPDVHVLRVLRRTGLVESDANIDSIIYKSRELCPEFPGIIDYSCWEIGRKWCRPTDPHCDVCIIRSDCLKKMKDDLWKNENMKIVSKNHASTV